VVAIFTDFEHCDEWYRYTPKSRWHTLASFEATYSDATLYAVTGTLEFVNHCRKLTPVETGWYIGLSLQEKPGESMQAPPWRWYYLSHSSFGGVTNGRFWCGTNSEVHHPPEESTSGRRVRHYLKPLIKGREHQPPDDPEATHEGLAYMGKALHPGGFFPVTCPRVKVVSPCVFSSTKWVLRALTVHEVAGCCDVPEAIINTLSPVLVERCSVSAMPFLFTSPAKILGGFVEALMLPQPLPEERQPLSTPNATPPSATIVREEEGHAEAPTERPLPELLYGRDKAAKNDDAAVNVGYWDDEIVKPWIRDPGFTRRVRAHLASKGVLPMEAFRKLALRTWRRNVWRSFRRYMRQRSDDWTSLPDDPGAVHDWKLTMEGARDCLVRCMGASWWEWMAGSHLLFWRWPQESQVWARDGLPIPLERLLTPYRKPQPREANPNVVTAVRAKLDKFRNKGYVVKGTVESLTSYFTVPKGDGDVRIVFDRTKSGLNDVIWTPTFSLPSADTLLATLEPGTWMADIDVGEQIYNFQLDPNIRPYCGLDLSPYYPDATAWEYWCQCVMGLKSSPYGCVRMDHLGDEVNRGNPQSPFNPFRYDFVRLN